MKNLKNYIGLIIRVHRDKPDIIAEEDAIQNIYDASRAYAKGKYMAWIYIAFIIGIALGKLIEKHQWYLTWEMF